MAGRSLSIPAARAGVTRAPWGLKNHEVRAVLPREVMARMRAARDPEVTRSVLIVQEDANEAKELARVLAKLRYPVKGHTIALADALERWQMLRPDVVILDARLAPEDEPLQAARAIHRESDLPVVVFATDPGAFRAREVGDNGPFSTLVKPFRPADLRAAIEIACARNERARALRDREELLRGLSLHDDGTGLFNRRGFAALAEQQLRLMRRSGESAALYAIHLEDLDGLAERQGEPAAERVRVAAASVMRQTFRDPDILACLGRDELVALAPGVAAAEAARVVARLERNWAQHKLEDSSVPLLRLEIGVAIHSSGESLESWIARAGTARFEKVIRETELESLHVATGT